MEEQRNVAKKRRLDAANQDLSDGAGAGSPDVDVDVGPPRRAKNTAGGPGDTCGGTVLATEEVSFEFVQGMRFCAPTAATSVTHTPRCR